MYVDPPVSKQKTVRKHKPDGTKEISHTIEHDTTVRALRHSKVKGRGDHRPMHPSPFRSPSYIATHHAGQDNPEVSSFDRNIDDRRNEADPGSERPAPRDRRMPGIFDDAFPIPGLRRTQAPAQGDPRNERPAPLDNTTPGFDIPYDAQLDDELPTGDAGTVYPQPTMNVFTDQERYYNPIDEFDPPGEFNRGTGKIRRKNRRKRPQDAGTMGRNDPMFHRINNANSIDDLDRLIRMFQFSSRARGR